MSDRTRNDRKDRVDAVLSQAVKDKTLDSLVRAATTAVSDLSAYLTLHNDKRRYDVNKAWHILYNL